MISYDEILNNMKNAYFDETGLYPDMHGKAGARLKACASELFNIYVYANQILKQGNYKTATNESLEELASQCGLTRQVGNKSQGKLTFYINEVSESDIEIPSGTICSKDGKRYIQYKTTESATIKAGTLSVEVGAEGVGVGKDYNTDQRDITIMVTPPSGVVGVYNSSKFVSGFDNETDEELRQRITNALTYPANGLSCDFIESRIKELYRVLDARIVKDGSSLVVQVVTFNGSLDEDTNNKIKNLMGVFYLLNISYSVRVVENIEH